LGGALGSRADRLAGRMEEVGEHADAALLDLRSLGVLGVVDEVAVEVLADQVGDVRSHPGGDERRQVLLRVAVDEELLLDQEARRGRVHGRFGDAWSGAGSPTNRARAKSLDAFSRSATRRDTTLRRG